MSEDARSERGETGELRPPDLALVGRAQHSGKLLRAIEQHDMTHAVFAPVLDPAQARRANRQTCLLLNLTNDGICKGFTLFNMTARKKQRLASWDLCGPAPKPCCRGGARTYSSVRRAQSVSCTTRPFGFENLLAIHDYCALCGTFALALSLSARTAKTSTVRACCSVN